MFALVNGLLAGLGLAAFLALGDNLFGTSTFQVLMDLSYVPGMETYPPIVELLIHLVISVAIAFFLMYFYPRESGFSQVRYMSIWMLFFAAGFIPFSLLSSSPMSWAGFGVWVMGHLLYALMLAIQVRRYR